MNEVYKIKETATGASKIVLRDDQFDPPVEMLEEQFGKLSRSLEVLYEGVLILGTDYLLKWEMAKNMMRPKSDYTKVLMNYSIVAPRMYKGKIARWPGGRRPGGRRPGGPAARQPGGWADTPVRHTRPTHPSDIYIHRGFQRVSTGAHLAIAGGYPAGAFFFEKMMSFFF